jgi:membrane fusion protein (multidrug efflux system)
MTTLVRTKGSSRDTEEKRVLEILEPRSKAASAKGRVTDDEVRRPLAKEAPEAERAPQDRRSDGANSPANKQQAKDQSRDDVRRGALRRRAITAGTGAIFLLVAVASGYVYWDHAQRFQSTDDAFIEARQFAVAPKVSGYITAVPVTDNQHVAAGDVIARIDDRDYGIALNQARAQVAAAEASSQNLDAQIAVQQAQISENEAQIEQAQASLTFAAQQAARYEDLAQRGAGSVHGAPERRNALS